MTRRRFATTPPSGSRSAGKYRPHTAADGFAQQPREADAALSRLRCMGCLRSRYRIPRRREAARQAVRRRRRCEVLQAWITSSGFGIDRGHLGWPCTDGRSPGYVADPDIGVLVLQASRSSAASWACVFVSFVTVAVLDRVLELGDAVSRREASAAAPGSPADHLHAAHMPDRALLFRPAGSL